MGSDNSTLGTVWQQVLSQLNQLHGERSSKSGEGEERLEQLRAALRESPRDPDRCLALVQCCKDMDRHDEALEVLRNAVRLSPRQVSLHHAYITILRQTGRTAELLESLDAAVKALPWDLSLRLRSALMLPIVYESDEEIGWFRARYEERLSDCIRQIPLDTRDTARRAVMATGSHTPFYLPYQGLDVVGPQRQYGELMCRIMAAYYPQWSVPLPMPPVENGRLRIGFASACFHSHSITKTHGGWMKCLAESSDVYGYYVGTKTDSTTDEIRGYCRQFRHFPYNFEEACQAILADRLHALVIPEIGLNAWTTQLAALRLAPIQCTSWGQPVTSGLPTVDYYLSSALMEPANGQEHYSETLVPLAGTGIYYEDPNVPFESLVKTRQDFGLRQDAVIFLWCQSLYKYLPRYDRVLVELARRVPNSQFVMVSPNYVPAGKYTARLERAFAAGGVDSAGRYVMLPQLDTISFWNLYRVSDIFLDSFSWSGCNTALEAIACGLPIVTCPGEFMRGRHSYAILTQMGVTETIAANEEQYIEIAVRLACDGEWRRQVAARTFENRHRLYRDRACIDDLQKFFRQVVQPRVTTSGAWSR